MKILSDQSVKLTKAEMSVLRQAVNILRVLEALDSATYKSLVDGLVAAVATHEPKAKNRPTGTPLFDALEKQEQAESLENASPDPIIEDFAST